MPYLPLSITRRNSPLLPAEWHQRIQHGHHGGPNLMKVITANRQKCHLCIDQYDSRATDNRKLIYGR